MFEGVGRRGVLTIGCHRDGLSPGACSYRGDTVRSTGIPQTRTSGAPPLWLAIQAACQSEGAGAASGAPTRIWLVYAGVPALRQAQMAVSGHARMSSSGREIATLRLAQDKRARSPRNDNPIHQSAHRLAPQPDLRRDGGAVYDLVRFSGDVIERRVAGDP